MTTLDVTLNLPDNLYRRLKLRAERTNRSLEEETVDVLASAVPVDGALPAGLAEAVGHLDLLDDEALWRAARSALAAEATEKLEQLHFKRQREGLTEAEEQETVVLLRQYERAMLVRASAAAILRERGHDISVLAPRP